MNPVVLAPQRSLSRLLSPYEYFHASVGSSAGTLDRPRETTYLVEGTGQLPVARWQAALDAVVAEHPACRLRIVGRRRTARFESDGAPTALRRIAQCDWDGQSHVGAECLRATSLSLHNGPMSELLILESRAGDTPRTRVGLRVNHAAMDGLGQSLILQELFRALRGEPLAGNNASFCDTDLMRHVGATRSTSRPLRCATLTGAPHGDDPAIWWRRVHVNGRVTHSMQKLVSTFADIAREHSPGLPVLFSLPINLRRHLDGLSTAQNFGNLLFVALHPGEDARVFKQRLNSMLSEKMDAAYNPAFDRIRSLPARWVDWLTQRRPGNYRRKKPLETCMISHLGYTRTADYSCDGFSADGVFGVPGSTAVFCTVFATERGLDAVFGMPAVFGSNGRFERVVERLQRALGAC